VLTIGWNGGMVEEWNSGKMGRDATGSSLFVFTSWLKPVIIYGTKAYGSEEH
jgi:hypothetical protein